MLTRRRPFSGDSVAATMAAILERDPDWQLLPKRTPANVRRLLQRCLEKDVEKRLRDIGDARLEIDEARSGGSRRLLLRSRHARVVESRM